MKKTIIGFLVLQLFLLGCNSQKAIGKIKKSDFTDSDAYLGDQDTHFEVKDSFSLTTATHSVEYHLYYYENGIWNTETYHTFNWEDVETDNLRIFFGITENIFSVRFLAETESTSSSSTINFKKEDNLIMNDMIDETDLKENTETAIYACANEDIGLKLEDYKEDTLEINEEYAAYILTITIKSTE